MIFSNLNKLWGRYRTLPSNVLAISIVSLLNDASSEIIYPLLPVFLALILGATPTAIGAIEGLSESVASLLKLFSGYISDKLNKRKGLVIFGYSISTLVRPFLGLATNWYQVLFFRLFDRLGKGIRSAPRDALIAASVDPKRRGLAFGLHRALDHTGAVIGPLLGFFLISFIASDPQKPLASEYTQVFLMASIPAVLAVLVMLIFVKDEEKQINEPTIVTKPTFSLKGFDGNFKRFLVIIAVFTLCNSSDALLLLRAQDVGVPTTMIPLLWAVHNFSKVVFSLIGGDMSDRIGRKTLIFSGWIVYSLVYLGFAFVSAEWQAWALFVVYGIYFGLTEGVEKALVADLVPKEKRGTAFGWYYLAIGITVFPASLLIGALWEIFNAKTAFITSAVIGIISAILILTVKTNNPELSEN